MNHSHSEYWLHASIVNGLQLNAHTCVSSRVTDDKMLSCVHGYHIYYSIWNLCVGEILCCESG